MPVRFPDLPGSDGPAGPGAGGPPAALALGGLAAWFTVTVLSQHPSREFDRVAERDRTGVAVPNWRFFAPEPAQHDYHVLYRTEAAGGGTSGWLEASAISDRRPSQMLWFPRRRREKGLFDVCSELITVMKRYGADLTGAPAYRMLRNSVARVVETAAGDGTPPLGFQFVVARHTGHDTGHPPDYVFASPYIPYDPAAPYP
jgi:hypothetical protein